MRKQDFLEVQSLLPPSHPAIMSFLLGIHLKLVLITIAGWAMYFPGIRLSYIGFKMSSIMVWGLLTKQGGKRTVFKPWLFYRVFTDGTMWGWAGHFLTLGLSFSNSEKGESMQRFLRPLPALTFFVYVESWMSCLQAAPLKERPCDSGDRISRYDLGWLALWGWDSH